MPSIYLRPGTFSDPYLNIIQHEEHSYPTFQIPLMIRMDSATQPCGSAQNESMVGDVQSSYRNEGWVQSCSCGADFSQLTLRVFATHKDSGKGLCYGSFPTTFRARLLDVPMKVTSMYKNSTQLLTPKNLFCSVPECHFARRVLMSEVAESTTDTNRSCDSA